MPALAVSEFSVAPCVAELACKPVMVFSALVIRTLDAVTLARNPAIAVLAAITLALVAKSADTTAAMAALAAVTLARSPASSID